MSAQSTDTIIAQRQGIDGTITIGDILSLAGGSTYDSSTRQKVIETDYIYHSWERTDGAGYIAKRVELGTNVITEATGSLPVPVLTTLTYS